VTGDESVSGWGGAHPYEGRPSACPRHLPEGRRGSEVKGGPQGRRLRREAPLSLEERPGTLARRATVTLDGGDSPRGPRGSPVASPRLPRSAAGQLPTPATVHPLVAAARSASARQPTGCLRGRRVRQLNDGRAPRRRRERPASGRFKDVQKV
jgi:hypothetical protein